MFDLRDQRGTQYVVFRRDQISAQRALCEHLLDIGAASSVEEAFGLACRAPVESVAVTW